MAARPWGWPVLPFATAAAVLAGIRYHRTPNPGSARLVALALVLLGIGDIVIAVGGDAQLSVTDGSTAARVATVPYLAAQGVFVAAALHIARTRMPTGDRVGGIDALIVMVAMSAVLWDLVSSPRLSGQLRPAEVAAVTVFPAIAAAVVACMVRVLLADATRLWSAWLLLVSTGATVAGHITLTANGGLLFHPAAKALWAIAYLALAAAELHPDIVALHQPVDERRARLAYGRLVVLGASLLAVPLVLLRSWQSGTAGPLVAIIASTLLVVLVLWRLALMLGERERAMDELARRAAREGAQARISETAVGPASIDELLGQAATTLGRVLATPVRVALADGVGRRSTDLLTPTAAAPAHPVEVDLSPRVPRWTRTSRPSCGPGRTCWTTPCGAGSSRSRPVTTRCTTCSPACRTGGSSSSA